MFSPDMLAWYDFDSRLLNFPRFFPSATMPKPFQTFPFLPIIQINQNHLKESKYTNEQRETTRFLSRRVMMQ